jgi:hypothetical protein
VTNNGVEVSDKSALSWILIAARRLIKWSIALFAVAVFWVVAWVWHGEMQRESLLQSYQAPTFYLNMLGAIVGAQRLETLMNDDEVIVCFLTQRTLGNLKVDSISALSGAQISAARNVLLPSPDSDGRYWYILFFTPERISRIYYVYNHDLDFDLANTNSGCAHRSMKFVIGRKNNEMGARGLLIKFQKGE